MPSGVLRVNARPAKIKLRIKSSGAPASANVEITDVMFQPGAAASGWLPHVTELPWVAGVTEMDSGGGSVVVRWEDIEGKPLAFPPQSHVHGWSEIQDKPTAFPPATHGHSMDDVAGLATALAGKANGLHSHASATETVAGFMSAADKSRLDVLSKDSGWLPITMLNGATPEAGGAWFADDGKALHLRGQIFAPPGTTFGTTQVQVGQTDGVAPPRLVTGFGNGPGVSYCKVVWYTNGRIGVIGDTSGTTNYVRLDNMVFKK